MDKEKTVVIKGFIPYGIHKKKGELYFSTTKQKWVNKIMKLKMSDILLTPTLPLFDNRFDKIGIYNIEINMEL